MLLTQANEFFISTTADLALGHASRSPRRIGPELRASILDAYVPSCIYLKDAWRDTDCLSQLMSHGRPGFLWQKVREPRS